MSAPLPNKPVTFARHENGLGIWRGSELIGVIEVGRLLRLIALAAMIADERG
jgi:hypothetical protein